MSALLMTIIILPILGIALNNAFEKHIKAVIKDEMTALSYGILAVTEVENKQLILPEQLLENQFNIIDSGLYAFYQPLDAFSNGLTPSFSSSSMLWQSPSMFDMHPPDKLLSPIVGQQEFYERSSNQHSVFVYSFAVSFSSPNSEFPVVLHIIKDQQDFLISTQEFKQSLWLWLLFLFITLVVVQLLWLQWTLKPLAKLKKELQQVEQGISDQIKDDYPHELQQVSQQLNTLLHTENSQRQRYRNALADLAHSLKTPLASIQSEPDVSKPIQTELANINKMIEHQLKRAQSAGDSSWRLGVRINPVVEKLANALRKIYQDKAINLQLDIEGSLIFKGDEADFLEIIGNLADNAFKAAKSQVLISAQSLDNQLVLTVSDDGDGIDEQHQQIILKRGMRADTYLEGHGIGLAIVRDLVTSYQGQLAISSSAQLGGAEFKLTFSK